jgi:hypothetical protein
VIDYTLSALSDRLDKSFLTASLLPAFVAVVANLGLIAMLMGRDAVEAWLYELTSFEEIIVTVIILVVIMMIGVLLRALSFIVVSFFVGEAFPRLAAEWSIRGQRRNWARVKRRTDGAVTAAAANPLHDQARRLFDQRFPQDEAVLRPTRLGNVLAAGAEYPWIVYAMEGLLWFPHLWPLLPSYVSDALDGAQARLLGLLNISLVLAVVACEAVVLLGFIGQQWTAALAVAVAGGVFAWLSYLAAVSQALEVTSQIRVAFNLYRQEILKQLGLTIPDSLAKERALWETLTRELLGLVPEAASASDWTATAPAAADGRRETAAQANG